MEQIKEVKLKIGDKTITPFVLINSIRNLDGTLYKDLLQSLLNAKASTTHNHASLFTALTTGTSGSGNYTYTFGAMSVGEVRFFSVYRTNTNRKYSYTLYLRTPSSGTYTCSYIKMPSGNESPISGASASVSASTNFTSQSTSYDEDRDCTCRIAGVLIRKS